MPRKTKEQEKNEVLETEVKPVVKRGRPKKEVVEAEAKPPVKRGRPKKEVVEAETKSKATTKAKSTTTKKKTTTTKKKTTAKKASAKKELNVEDLLSNIDNEIDTNLNINEYYDLPYKYNQTVIKILAQTPTSLFIYWEISDDDIENYKKLYGDNFFETTRPVLVIHNETLGYSFEVEINDFANNWYLSVDNSKCKYKAELGRRPNFYSENINTDYIYITDSNDIEAPNDHILIEEFPEYIKFRNTANNHEYCKHISELISVQPIYNIYEMYKKMYKNENVNDFSNPSSNSSSSFTSKFI